MRGALWVAGWVHEVVVLLGGFLSDDKRKVQRCQQGRNGLDEWVGLGWQLGPVVLLRGGQ